MGIILVKWKFGENSSQNFLYLTPTKNIYNYDQIYNLSSCVQHEQTINWQESVN